MAFPRFSGGVFYNPPARFPGAGFGGKSPFAGQGRIWARLIRSGMPGGDGARNCGKGGFTAGIVRFVFVGRDCPKNPHGPAGSVRGGHYPDFFPRSDPTSRPLDSESAGGGPASGAGFLGRASRDLRGGKITRIR